MSSNQAPDGKSPSPEFQAILDAIDEISMMANRNETGPTHALKAGYVHPELQDKFTKLGDKLTAFGKGK